MTSTTYPAYTVQAQQQRVQMLNNLLLFGCLIALFLLFFVEPALATGTGTTTGTGGAGAAQTRITNVATGWQNIIMGVGVVILIVAWAVIGYQIAFNGKTMKDMQNPAMGTSIAGLAPVLVGWMFS